MTEPPDDARNWNADYWHLFLCQHCDNRANSPHGMNTVALKIADTMDALRAPPSRFDAESAGLATFTPITGPGVDALENRKEADNGPSEEQVNADLRRYLVPPPSEAGRDRIAKYICHRFICANSECDECEPSSVAREHADTILAISRRDPGTVAVASAQYRCTCGAEPYCAPNVHAASCPLAVISTHEPWQPVLYGPTDWRQLPHTCPPGAAEKFYAEAFERGRKEPRPFPLLVTKERLAEQIAADPDIECEAGPSVTSQHHGGPA